VPQKAQLYRTYHKDGSKAICVDKPNSTGVDEVTCRGFDGMMHLCNGEVTRSDGRALDLAMCKAGRETPVARERRNKVMVCRNMVVAEPDASLVNRMQSSTEERNLGDADLDSKIRVTPRNRTTIRDGTVFTTDTNDKGTREAQRWEPVGGYHIGLQATNCQITTVRNQEQWETNLVATKCMSTGRDQDRKRKRLHRGDFTVNHASGSSQSVRDLGKCKELSTLLCVLPHITGSFLCLMNKLGFTSMEIAPLSQMYMDFLFWRFDSLFNRFVGVRLGKSFQRTCQGHYGRHIADYAMSRLTLEVSKADSFDKALGSTMNALSYNCFPVGAVPGWFDDAMREGVDGQLLVLHNVMSSMLSVPFLSLEWLCKALLPYDSLSDADKAYVDNHADAMKLALWVKDLIDNDCFVFEQDVVVYGGGGGGGAGGGGGGGGGAAGGGGGGNDAGVRVERGERRTHPYISTPAKASEEHGYLRARTKNKGFSEEIAKKIVKHPDMVTYSKNTGFTVDDKVAKCMVDRCSHLTLGLENAFGTYDLCNPETFFAIARRKLGDHAIISPISDVVQRNTSAMLDPSYAMMQSVNVYDTAEIMYGVNMTLSVILTSLVEGNTACNSQVDERLTRSIMYLMMRDVPKQFLGQGGSTYLRKNFRGNCPQVDLNDVSSKVDARPAYFVRPDHDHEKEFNRMTHMSCDIYLKYAPEDCAHMGELAALVQNYEAASVLDISLTHATPRYMFLFDVVYPIAFTQEGMHFENERLDDPATERVRGYLVIASPRGLSTATAAANTTPWKLRYYGEQSAHHNTSGDDASDIDEALALRFSVAMPLVRRHNAVVYDRRAEAFGVVMPTNAEPDRTDFSLDTYFDGMPSSWGARLPHPSPPPTACPQHPGLHSYPPARKTLACIPTANPYILTPFSLARRLLGAAGEPRRARHHGRAQDGGLHRETRLRHLGARRRLLRVRGQQPFARRRPPRLFKPGADGRPLHVRVRRGQLPVLLPLEGLGGLQHLCRDPVQLAVQRRAGPLREDGDQPGRPARQRRVLQTPDERPAVPQRPKDRSRRHCLHRVLHHVWLPVVWRVLIRGMSVFE